MTRELERVVTAAEAAVLIRMSERQVREHAAAGRLVGRRAGSVWLLLRADVLAFRARARKPGRPKLPATIAKQKAEAAKKGRHKK